MIRFTLSSFPPFFTIFLFSLPRSPQKNQLDCSASWIPSVGSNQDHLIEFLTDPMNTRYVALTSVLGTRLKRRTREDQRTRTRSRNERPQPSDDVHRSNPVAWPAGQFKEGSSRRTRSQDLHLHPDDVLRLSPNGKCVRARRAVRNARVTFNVDKLAIKERRFFLTERNYEFGLIPFLV